MAKLKLIWDIQIIDCDKKRVIESRRVEEPLTISALTDAIVMIADFCRCQINALGKGKNAGKKN